MATKRPRFLVTLKDEQQHALLKTFARLSGRSVSAVLNDLVDQALTPLAMIGARAGFTGLEGQTDLEDFLRSAAGAEPLHGSPGGLVDPAAERASTPRRASEAEGSTPVSNTGVGFRQVIENKGNREVPRR
jgi:hypothetical protein